ncbi:MAG TPA: hypothetical protein VHA55_00620 [Pseudorhodoplanes sp.]|nr:hypothetical protein [Pseudorhodoplanes sp.]
MRNVLILAGAAFLFQAAYASAQSVPQQQLGNSGLYPGAIYIAPQDSSFVAPAIYRSIEPRKEFENPMNISQICMRDFRETAALKSLYSGTSEAAGLMDTVHKNFAAKLAGIDLKVIKLEGNLEIKNEASFSATPLKIIYADDDIADVIIANIGDNCKKIVVGHLKQGRLVFFASKAIQAKEFTVSLNVGPKATGGLSCTIPIFCPSVSTDVDFQRQRKRSSVQHVTFAIVPAEINGRLRPLRTDDLK